MRHHRHIKGINTCNVFVYMSIGNKIIVSSVVFLFGWGTATIYSILRFVVSYKRSMCLNFQHVDYMISKIMLSVKWFNVLKSILEIVWHIT